MGRHPAWGHIWPTSTRDRSISHATCKDELRWNPRSHSCRLYTWYCFPSFAKLGNYTPSYHEQPTYVSCIWCYSKKRVYPVYILNEVYILRSKHLNIGHIRIEKATSGNKGDCSLKYYWGRSSQRMGSPGVVFIPDRISPWLGLASIYRGKLLERHVSGGTLISFTYDKKASKKP